MCDPTVIAVASTVAGIAGTAANAFGAMSAANKQKEAYDQWAAQQHANRVAAAAKDEQDRQQADAARQQGLQQVGADAQKAQQATEQARLTQFLQGTGSQTTDPSTGTSAPISVTDASLSGQGASTDPTFKADLASKLNAAAAGAKQRIGALAAVSSYGGSQGGLDQFTSQALAKSGQGIDMANAFRKGDLGVLATQQAVNPEQITYQPSPLASISGDLLKFGANKLGNIFAG